MQRNIKLSYLGTGIILFASLFACHMERNREAQDIDVTAKTTLSGIVNGSPIEAEVAATFNTGRGGSSTCKFKEMPPRFNPATLGTHA